MCEICSKLTIKTPEDVNTCTSLFFNKVAGLFSHFSGVSIVNFEQVNTDLQLREKRLNRDFSFELKLRTNISYDTLTEPSKMKLLYENYLGHKAAIFAKHHVVYISY